MQKWPRESQQCINRLKNKQTSYRVLNTVLIKVLYERCGSWPQKCYGDGYLTGWLRHFIATSRRYEFFNFRSAEARSVSLNTKRSLVNTHWTTYVIRGIALEWFRNYLKSRIQVVGVELKIKEHCVFKEVQPAQWCIQGQRRPNGTGGFYGAGGWSRDKQGFRDDRRIGAKWNSRNVWSNWKLSSTIYRKSSIKSPFSNKPPPSNKPPVLKGRKLITRFSIRPHLPTPNYSSLINDRLH